MAEENEELTNQEPQEQTQEPHGSTPPAPHEVDWKAQARKWEERAKENKAKADKWDEQEEANKTELEKARELAQATKAELDALKKEKAHSELVSRVSATSGIPANLLHGTTEEELTASAEAIKSFLETSKPAYPQDKGGSASGGATMTLGDIQKIKNPHERIKAIAEHKDLFQ